jgi:hypothetical protein
MASILRVDTLTDASSGNSTAMSTIFNGTAKVWVNFNGTGTVAIRDGTNAASLTDEGTGDYTVNFTSAMTDTNYCTNVAADSDTKNQAARIGTTYSLGTTSSIRMIVYNSAAGAHQDPAVNNVSVQGDLA